jgi:hypothetical protein
MHIHFEPDSLDMLPRLSPSPPVPVWDTPVTPSFGFQLLLPPSTTDLSVVTGVEVVSLAIDATAGVGVTFGVGKIARHVVRRFDMWRLRWVRAAAARRGGVDSRSVVSSGGNVAEGSGEAGGDEEDTPLAPDADSVAMAAPLDDNSCECYYMGYPPGQRDENVGDDNPFDGYMSMMDFAMAASLDANGHVQRNIDRLRETTLLFDNLTRACQHLIDELDPGSCNAILFLQHSSRLDISFAVLLLSAPLPRHHVVARRVLCYHLKGMKSFRLHSTLDPWRYRMGHPGEPAMLTLLKSTTTTLLELIRLQNLTSTSTLPSGIHSIPTAIHDYPTSPFLEQRNSDIPIVTALPPSPSNLGDQPPHLDTETSPSRSPTPSAVPVPITPQESPQLHVAPATRNPVRARSWDTSKTRRLTGIREAAVSRAGRSGVGDTGSVRSRSMARDGDDGNGDDENLFATLCSSGMLDERISEPQMDSASLDANEYIQRGVDSPCEASLLSTWNDAPVAKSVTVRFQVAVYSALQGWHLQCFDTTRAFVWDLTVKASRIWYRLRRKVLKTLGFSRSKFDHAILILNRTYLGPLNPFVGIQFKRDYVIWEIWINDWKMHIESLLVEHNLASCNAIVTPLDRSSPLGPVDVTYSPITNLTHAFQHLVGSLLFLQLCSWPDISFEVLLALSQSCSSPLLRHYAVARRVLRYLKWTKTFRLHYGGVRKDEMLSGMTDADWAGDRSEQASNSGFVWSYGGGPIGWLAKKQNCVSLSSTKAEYVALTHALQEGIWLRNSLRQIQVPCPSPLVISTVDISLASNDSSHGHAEHRLISSILIENGDFDIIHTYHFQFCCDALRPLAMCMHLEAYPAIESLTHAYHSRPDIYIIRGPSTSSLSVLFCAASSSLCCCLLHPALSQGQGFGHSAPVSFSLVFLPHDFTFNHDLSPLVSQSFATFTFFAIAAMFLRRLELGAR